MHLKQRQWPNLDIKYIKIRRFVLDLAKAYRAQIEKWPSPFVEGALEDQPDLGKSYLVHYACEIAVRRLSHALGEGGSLKSYVILSDDGSSWEIPQDYWGTSSDGSLAFGSIIEKGLTDQPFGTDLIYSGLSPYVGTTIYLQKLKADAWRKRHSWKLNRLFAPLPLVRNWYARLSVDDPDRRSLARLKARAARELRMQVSESQIDELTAGEGRKVGRPLKS